MTKDKSKLAGAIARRDALTPEERRDIALKAAAARWGEKPVKATHKGNFKKHFGIDVDCYVLDDAAKTAVMSQKGVAQALGLSPRGNALPRFLSNKAITETVGAGLIEKEAKVVKFQWGAGGADQPPAIINGYDTGFLIDICNAIIEANNRGLLSGRYENVVKQAQILNGAAAKNGIKHLVYSLAGYNPSAEEVISSFKVYVQEEARKYEQEFPNDLYMQWHRLYEVPILERGKPWLFKHLTVKHIYFPLAKSNGKLLQLLRALKASDGDRKKKLFQFLNEVGARALRMHMGRVLEMAESSEDQLAYERKIASRFGDQPELDLVMPSSPSASLLPSSQSQPDAPAT
jgi:hypothetical protein